MKLRDFTVVCFPQSCWNEQELFTVCSLLKLLVSEQV